MKLLTKQIEKKLKAQGEFRNANKHKPIVKFFGVGAFTWLISEMDADGDTLFGLCDLGFGCPELGYVSLSELESLKFPPFGLGVERDLHFKADKTLSEYADEARKNERIVA
tara:strand:+ start:570 stop:902 length:333 start_codon:yes stop_codon:yes gene_type:complete